VLFFAFDVNLENGRRASGPHTPQMKRGWIARIKRAIVTWPLLFGMFIAVVLAGLMLVTVIWFPGTTGLLDNHSTLAIAALITVSYFGSVFFWCPRHWRRSRAFWPTICILLLFHVVGVYLYSTLVGRILMWQWEVIGAADFIILSFVLQKFSTTERKNAENSSH
jgi:hypothetical protein